MRSGEPSRSAVLAPRLHKRPSLTAEAVAFARALEQHRPPQERVIDDPFAKLFLSRTSRVALSAWAGSLTGRALRRRGGGGTSYVALRHRFIDDHLVTALAAGARQLVLLGAGYDARAYRFEAELAGRPVFEVDLAPISRAKAATIERHADVFTAGNVVRVEIDFERESLVDKLADAGLCIGDPTFVVWEGVPMYLTRSAVASTLDAIWALTGPGSRLAFDMWHLVDEPGLMGTARRLAPGALSVIGEPVTFAVHPDDVDGFLRSHGFAVAELASADELRERFAPDARAVVDPSLYVLVADRLP